MLSLTVLPAALHITLYNNPCTTIPGYRHFMVNSVPTLLALDLHVVTDEERIEDASFGYRFRSMHDRMRIDIPDYTGVRTAEEHLFNMEIDIYCIKRLFE